jgi:hypothetical protein
MNPEFVAPLELLAIPSPASYGEYGGRWLKTPFSPCLFSNPDIEVKPLVKFSGGGWKVLALLSHCWLSPVGGS